MGIDIISTHLLIESPKDESDVQFCEAVESMILQTYGHRPHGLKFSAGARFVRNGIYFREMVCFAGSVAGLMVWRAGGYGVYPASDTPSGFPPVYGKGAYCEYDFRFPRAIIERADNDGVTKAFEIRDGVKQDFCPDELKAV